MPGIHVHFLLDNWEPSDLRLVYLERNYVLRSAGVKMKWNEVRCLWVPSLGWTFGLDWESLILWRASTKENLPLHVNAIASMRFDSRGHAVRMVIKIHCKLPLSGQPGLDGPLESKIPWLHILFRVPGFVPLHRDFLVQRGREERRHFFFVRAHKGMFCPADLQWVYIVISLVVLLMFCSQWIVTSDRNSSAELFPRGIKEKVEKNHSDKFSAPNILTADVHSSPALSYNVL